MSEARRAEMGAAAVAAAQAVGYVGAGTVEFIAEEMDDGDLRFYFMEMNTRLQVEHPVTEAITGLDLVEWQLRVAAGEPLPMTQEALRIHGHAIEARICAENPASNFLPATGTLVHAAWPAHVAFRRNADAEPLHDPAPVRIDRGFDQGDAITPYYDSMIAKLIVWGADRAQALARLDAALRDTRLVGVQTNVAFLRRVVATRAFSTADLDTGLIEREHAALFEAPPLAIEVAAAGVVALARHEEGALEDADPWSRRDGWRLHGGARRRFDLEVDGAAQAVTLTRLHDGATVLEIGERRWPIAARVRADGRHDVTLGDRRLVLSVLRDGEKVAVFAPEGSAVVTETDRLAHAGDRAGEGGKLTAPMPGKLLQLLVDTGDRVEAGQPLAVMEAMKMEHTLHAPRDGEVGELLYRVGDQVPEGAELLRLGQA
jgi:3-methylcrotonyl-CoA carboxylase alpha subunit